MAIPGSLTDRNEHEMDQAVRKKSPRAPSIALDDAIERALKVYEKERRHVAPVDVFAQDLGYKSANNGAALATLASLRYYGLLDRPREGHLAVSKDVESYKFAPSDELRRELLVKWLKAPPIFSELLEKYQDGLPSEATIRYDLIQRGFTPPTAEACINVFRRSVDFTRYFELGAKEQPQAPQMEPTTVDPGGGESIGSLIERTGRDSDRAGDIAPKTTLMDRIPVRLAGGRRAWLEIPTPFYGSDKDRLKAQIDLLLTDDESAGEK